jgi:hypothetical protein
MHCTFEEFMPGTDSDADSNRTFDDYLNQFRANAQTAGALIAGPDFTLNSAAIAKVEGDVFELIEAGALWNAVAAWNRFMDSGVWDSTAFTQPEGAVATPTRKVAILKLPRGYNALELFQPEIRGSILAHEQALRLRGMELGFSSPDIVGVRLPHPLPDHLGRFLLPLENLNAANFGILTNSYRQLANSVGGMEFMLAVAIKRTVRSDRLYQPLFEANILKYLIEVVLRGAAFRFYAHMNSFEGADVEGHYRAASLVSLLRGGTPVKAIDSLYLAKKPRDTAQSILNDLPLFPT